MSADFGVKSPQPGGELSEGREGERQRGYGLLIAAGMRRLRQGVKELKGEGGVTGNGHRRRFRSKLEDDFALTKGPHRSVRRRRETGYRFGNGCWAAGSNRYWAEKVPRGPFCFYFFFLLFFFWKICFESL
jgi:hypothetical protein